MSGKEIKPDTVSQKKRFVRMIQERILSGELKPGDRLPPERDLAAQTGISRSSINQGVLDLERQGFLRVAPRKGAFVADYRRNAIPQTLPIIMSCDSCKLDYALFHDFMATRLLIERECARLACLHMSEKSAAVLDRYTELMDTGDQAQLVDTYYQFHHDIVQLAGNAIYAMIFSSFEGAIRRLTEIRYQTKEKLDITVPLYKKLVRALKAGEPEAAGRCMADILVTTADHLRGILGFPETEDFLSGRP